MKILVTGANSPLGSFFIRRLLETFTDCSIVALSRKQLDIDDDRLTVIYFDLLMDSFSVNKEFDVVIHAASLVPNAMKNVFELNKVNIEGSFNLFKRIKLTNNSLILNFSSSSVYDDPYSQELFEDSQKTSNNDYGLSKLKFENMLLDFYEKTSVSLLSLRLPVVLVKNVQNNFMANWLRLIKSGEPIGLAHPNALFNACIYSEDIFQFFLKYLKQKSMSKNLTCNISSKNPIKVIDAAKLIMKAVNSIVPIIEKSSIKPAQLISYDLAYLHGFEPRSVKESIMLFSSD